MVNMPSPLLDLPDHIWTIILRNLEWYDIANLQDVDARLAQLGNNIFFDEWMGLFPMLEAENEDEVESDDDVFFEGVVVPLNPNAPRQDMRRRSV